MSATGSPLSPMSSDGDPWSPEGMLSPTSPNSRSGQKRSPGSAKGSPKDENVWEVASPQTERFNDVTQMEALIQNADAEHNKRGSGLVLLTQSGKHFYLDFINLKVRNPQERVLRIFLIKKKRCRGKKDNGTVEKKGFCLKLERGMDEGALSGPEVVNVSHFRQPLGTLLKGMGGVSPLDWVGICIAKPATEIPRTPMADIYAFGNFVKPEAYDREEEAAAAAAAAVEERRMLDVMMGQSRGSLTLRDVKRKAEAVFRHLDKKTNIDDLTYQEFCKGMKYLGVSLQTLESVVRADSLSLSPLHLSFPFPSFRPPPRSHLRPGAFDGEQSPETVQNSRFGWRWVYRCWRIRNGCSY